jgi:AraC-like DNA-binding protein
VIGGHEPLRAEILARLVLGTRARLGVDRCPCSGGPPGLAAIVAHRRQPIRRVPVGHPILIAVLEGHKDVHIAGRGARFSAGDLLVLPATLAPDIENVPDPRSGLYRALVVSFPRSLTRRFRRTFPDACDAARPAAAELGIPARPGLALALLQLVECLGAEPPPSAAQAEVRGMAVLLALVEECGCHLPLLPISDSPVVQLQSLIALAPAHPWALRDVARRLGLSEATLRRRLGAAGVRFRGLLEEGRLAHALGLLQTTREPIGEISAACGYGSPSRFAARFRRRFGLPPSRFR